MGPYYAMFPVAFADRVVQEYSHPGDLILDPFAGRGTSLFSAAAQGRIAIGIEINPVGWVYAQSKLKPAPQERVECRIRELGQLADDYRLDATLLPLFFKRCYSSRIRRFLVAARAQLDWRHSSVDRTVMAFLLVHLHGKRGGALSNQMRQMKAMSPAYAMRWWKRHHSAPPNLDPVEYMVRRVGWRYAKGSPVTTDASRAYLGDSVQVLAALRPRPVQKVALLFTSPPYYKVTNYHYDQWLRLWLLGEEPNARRKPGKHRAKFENAEQYGVLLHDVFSHAARLTSRDATIYVRTGREQTTYRTTCSVLADVFPRHKVMRRVRPFARPTQTRLFGDHEQKSGEVDLVLQRG